MTKKGVTEVVNKLRFKITKEILFENTIIINWPLKIPFNKKQITIGKAKAFIKVRSLEDKEEGIKSVELFVKDILISNSEKFQKVIEKR